MHQKIYQKFLQWKHHKNTTSLKLSRNVLNRKNKNTSDDLLELNDTDLNYIYFGDETNSGDAKNNSDEDSVL